MIFPKTLPQIHKQLLTEIINIFSQDPRIVGIGASGSFTTDSMDKYSDLDLVIAIEPNYLENVMEERFELVSSIEGYVAAFTGEHVGEPRLIIALYAPNAIHVDFKFVSLTDAGVRVDDTQVLWERKTRLSDVLSELEPHYPQPQPQWLEDRFWIWLHYGSTKIARGEYFEALEFLSLLRTVVLSPLALKQQGLTPSGVRKIETRLPDFSAALKKTVATPDRQSLVVGFENCIELYLQLRNKEQVDINESAQKLCLDYFKQQLV